jgi:hypothetical protein
MKCWDIVTTSGTRSRIRIALPRTLFWSGYNPVMKLAREGPHSGWLQYAFSNNNPLAASRSIFGVLTM